MSEQHYFSQNPTSPHRPREVQVDLAGTSLPVTTSGGLFSPQGIDKGTAVLLDGVPQPPAAGRFLDLGCGWGPIALTMALLSPGAQVDAVDVNPRAVELTAANAARHGLTGVRTFTPNEADPRARYDLIWSNPPIRVGKAVLHEILRTWLPRLAPGGHAWLVVQKNLGSDSLQRWIDQEFAPQLQVARAASVKGFRLLHITRAADREDSGT